MGIAKVFKGEAAAGGEEEAGHWGNKAAKRGCHLIDTLDVSAGK